MWKGAIQKGIKFIHLFFGYWFILRLKNKKKLKTSGTQDLTLPRDLYLPLSSEREEMHYDENLRTELSSSLEFLLRMLTFYAVELKAIILNSWRTMINYWCYWWSQIHANTVPVHFFSNLGSGSIFPIIFYYRDFFKKS